MEGWYIAEQSINKPMNYSAKRLSNSNIKHKLNGGTRKRKTTYGIISECNLYKNYIGNYKEHST
jgi:hypothetical protein